MSSDATPPTLEDLRRVNAEWDAEVSRPPEEWDMDKIERLADESERLTELLGPEAEAVNPEASGAPVD